MRRKLHPRELGDLLDRPLNAVLGLHRQGGSILLTPVWYLFKQGSFYFQVPGGDRKIAMSPGHCPGQPSPLAYTPY